MALLCNAWPRSYPRRHRLKIRVCMKGESGPQFPAEWGVMILAVCGNGGRSVPEKTEHGLGGNTRFEAVAEKV